MEGVWTGRQIPGNLKMAYMRGAYAGFQKIPCYKTGPTGHPETAHKGGGGTVREVLMLDTLLAALVCVCGQVHAALGTNLLKL